jgi:CubicO group peptidase (beta-lactamase class C family)
MMCHRTGLARNDAGWATGPNVTREQLVSKVQYLDSNLEFRSQWEYNNYMWMTAGYMVGQIQGATWEELIQEQIFTPLEMEYSTTDLMEAINSGNYAVSIFLYSMRLNSVSCTD